MVGQQGGLSRPHQLQLTVNAGFFFFARVSSPTWPASLHFKWTVLQVFAILELPTSNPKLR